MLLHVKAYLELRMGFLTVQVMKNRLLLTYYHSGGCQGPYLPSADSSEHDLKRGELRFMLPKVMRT
eukprot:SAG25_NODE_727_length_5698_cov_2.832649_9_plen_65_part_01